MNKNRKPTLAETIVSKARVRDHGEVLTSEREVNSMLDLVKQESERVDSRFLEPACGTGNFLSVILRRKLDVVAKRYKRSQLEYERSVISAIASIYGVDILQDNVEQCVNRLLDMFITSYRELYGKKAKQDVIDAAHFILSRNILWGDALSLRTPDKAARPIVFSEWTRPFNDSRIVRRDYYFHELTPIEKRDLLTTARSITSDTGLEGFIPEAFKEYPPTHFSKLKGIA